MGSYSSQAVAAFLAVVLLGTSCLSADSLISPHHDGDGDGTNSSPRYDDGDYSEVVLPRPTSSSDNFPPSDLMRLVESPQPLQISISGEQLQVVYLHPSAASTRAMSTGAATSAGFSEMQPPLILACQSGGQVNSATSEALLASLSPCARLPLSQWQSTTGSRSLGAALPANGVQAASLPVIGADRYPDGGKQIGRRILDLSAANANASCPTEYGEALSTRVMPSHCHRQYEATKHLHAHISPPYLSLPEWPITPTLEEGREGSESGKEWEGKLFELRDVFVDRWGRAFNATHFFHAGRCSDNSNKVSACEALRSAESCCIPRRGGARRLLTGGPLSL